jgi:hypothetical protein
MWKRKRNWREVDRKVVTGDRGVSIVSGEE